MTRPPHAPDCSWCLPPSAATDHSQAPTLSESFWRFGLLLAVGFIGAVALVSFLYVAAVLSAVTL